MSIEKIQRSLSALLNKYNIPVTESLNLLPGWFFLNKEIGNKDIPLMTWRSNRKFIELHNIVMNNIIEHVCMLRFSSMSNSRMDLSALLYREFDLCEFLGNGRIISLHATFFEKQGGNVIIKLNNGVIGSIEVGNQLPLDSKKIERHELIARRGVASDLVVDTQIPQQSVYLYTKDEIESYKDIDNELWGFDEDEVELIRSSFNYYKNSTPGEFYTQQHEHLSELVRSAFLSNRTRKKVIIEKEKKI